PEREQKYQLQSEVTTRSNHLYDPDSGDLEGWRRGGRALEGIAAMVGFVSPRLGIRFEPGAGPDRFTIIGPDGTPFRTVQEVIEQSEADQRYAAEQTERAEVERQRAEAERQRAEAECQRAERYAAKLRALGIEPD